MTVKDQPNPYWWPVPVAERVREVVPAGVFVQAQEDVMRSMLEVRLVEAPWRRVLRRLGLAESRGRVLTRATVELADAPAGLAIRVRWL